MIGLGLGMGMATRAWMKETFPCKARVPVKKNILEPAQWLLTSMPCRQVRLLFFFALVWAALETRIGIFTMMDVGFNVG